MDAAQWPQQVATLPKQMEEITSPTPQNNNQNNLTNSRVISTPLQQQSQERRTRPLKDQTINCPRCNSTNTKFCYYNNYSLTQPRYFCKTCRRYWTQGGTLRSVPVGGGSRKNKRSFSSTQSINTPPPASPSAHTKLIIPDLNPPTNSLSHLLNNTSSQNPNIKFLEGHDLNLAFPIQGLFHHQFPKIEGNLNNLNNNIENHEQQININSNNNNNNNSLCPSTTTTTTTTTPTQFSALDLLRTEIASRGNLNPFLPIPVSDPNTLYQSGYPNLHEYKPSMNFFSPHSDHTNNNNNNNNSNNNNNNNNLVGPNDHNNNNNNGARLLFPFADMNKLATNNNNNNNNQNDDHIHDHDDQSNKGNNGNNDHHGYWGGMLDGGTW